MILCKLSPLSRDNSSPRVDAGSMGRGNSNSRMENSAKLTPLSRTTASHINGMKQTKNVSSRRLVALDSELSLHASSSSPPMINISSNTQFVFDKRVTGSDLDPVQLIYEGELGIMYDGTKSFWAILYHFKFNCYELVLFGKLYLPISIEMSSANGDKIASPCEEYRRIYLSSSLVDSLVKSEDVNRIVQEKREFFKKRHRHFEVDTLYKLAHAQLVKECLEEDIHHIISQAELVKRNLHLDDESVIFTNIVCIKPELLVPININAATMEECHVKYLHSLKIYEIILKAIEFFQTSHCRHYRPSVTNSFLSNWSQSRFLFRTFSPDSFMVSVARYRWMRAIDLVIQRNIYLSMLRRLMRQALDRITQSDFIADVDSNAAAKVAHRHWSLRLRLMLGDDLSGSSKLIGKQVKFQLDLIDHVHHNKNSNSIKVPSPQKSLLSDFSLDRHQQFSQHVKNQQDKLENSVTGILNDINPGGNKLKPLYSNMELFASAFETNMC